MRKTTVFAVVLLLAALLPMALSASAGENPRGTIGKIMSQKVLRLGINAAGEPYMFRDVRGNPAGLSMDMQRLLAKEFDADLVITDVDWSGLIPSMLSKKTDFLAIHMSQTIARAKVVAFTEPFYVLQDIAFIRAADYDKYGDWRNLNQPGIKVAIIGGTHAEATAKQKFYRAELVTFNTDVDCYQALISGRVDAHVNGEGLWSMVQSNYGDTVVIADKPEPGLMADKMAYATRPDDLFTNKFLDFWLKANIENGKIPAIIDYWFNNDAYHDDFKKNAEIGKMSEDRDILVNL
ncbi:MAG: transporter substrate-binding domain-containing protein, partial [Planctomycetes bacterium]|nr:transporter substrate-binding domain-containing protein [Planctomycetota bacterium]